MQQRVVNPRGVVSTDVQRNILRDIQPKAASLLAEVITQDVVRRGWPLGLSLGTEAELIAQYKVSRATLREAIREIERQGVARMTRGTGLVIAEPARTTAVRCLTSYIRFSCIPLEEIVQVQRLLRVHAAGLATAHLDDAGILRLRALKGPLVAAKDARERQQIFDSIRAAVFELSSNPLMSVLLSALEPFSLDVIEMDALIPIVDMIISGDRSRAEELTRVALEQSRLNGRTADSIHNDSLASFKPPKLGEAISEVIARQVSRAAWASDARIGTEAGLRIRFGVSQSIIRESLSLLERHGIVFRQRGRNGGLLIRPPDPRYTVKVVSGLFRFLRLDAEHVLDVSGVLMAEATARTAQIATPQVLETLRALLDQHLEHEGGEFARAFVITIGDASGNRVLSLLLQTLLATFYTVPKNKHTKAFHNHIYELSVRIFEAIAGHDATLARRRVMQHDQWIGECIRGGVIRT